MEENDKMQIDPAESGGDTQENKKVVRAVREQPASKKKNPSKTDLKRKKARLKANKQKEKEKEKEKNKKRRITVFKKAKVKTTETGEVLKYKSHKAIYSVTIASVYIVLVIIASLVASFFVISIGNDVFALSKDERTAVIDLGMYPTILDVTNALAENGIIRYPEVFKLYARYKFRNEEAAFIPGTYTVSSKQNYNSLINTFLEQEGERRIVKITIPEGYTVDEIINIFLKENIGTREGFIDAIENGEYDYEFIKLLEQNEISKDRRYKLEGYIFPDTYFFYSDWSEKQIINKLLAGFDAKFTKEYYDFVAKSDHSLDDYIIIASIIQREAYYNADFELVSSVIHNRLDHSAIFPKLECDSTILYALKIRKTDITQEDLHLDDPYNTYVYDGLPPGPICNPGWDAIFTALTPAEDTGYYYFVSKADGEILYAKTLKEHNANVAEAREDKP